MKPGDRERLTPGDFSRLRELADAVRCAVMTRVSSVSTCPIAGAVMSRYLEKSVNAGTEITENKP